MAAGVDGLLRDKTRPSRIAPLRYISSLSQRTLLRHAEKILSKINLTHRPKKNRILIIKIFEI